MPSDQRGQGVRQLAAGIDTLYWSASPKIGSGLMAELRAARDAAAQLGEAQPWRDVLRHILTVGSHGAGRYPVYLDCPEFRIQITDSKHLPGIYVQLRAAFIHEVGVDEAFARSVAVAEQIAECAIGEPRVSRLDLYADFADWVIQRDDVAGLVTNAKVATHGRSGTDELETVMIGKTPMAVRVYRKDEEVRQRGGFAPQFWSGFPGPVLRVEVQASSEPLRALRISSVADAISCHGDLWAWATAEFVELRSPSRAQREAWAVRPEWLQVQQVTLTDFPRCGLVPWRVVTGRRDKVIPSLLGYLSTYGALENLSEPALTLRRLLAEFPDLTWSAGRTFRGEVSRKRARLLPTSYRMAQERLGPVASARDRSPSSKGGDSESSTVGSDA